MMSANARAARRGAMTELAFLAAVHRVGFVAVDGPPEGVLFTFMHPDAGRRRFYVTARMRGFAGAFDKLNAELKAARWLATPKAASDDF